MTTFEIAVVLHLVADWVLQNDWMARNKTNLRHPAGWIHGAVHAALLALVLPLPVALAVALTHVLIDTRVPARWWARVFKAHGTGDLQPLVAIGLDQTLHLVVLGVAVLATS